MSWLFSQALVAAYSEASCSDGEQSAPSNTTPTPQAFLSRDKTTDAWSRFPSGMTCEPLTADRGEELLMWFRAGFLVRTYRQPARGRASTESVAVCGEKWRASSVRYDRSTSSWKTAHCLLSEDLPSCSVTLPKWGMMRSGELLEPHTLPHLTKDSACGWSVPTPRASTGTHGVAWVRAESGQHRSQLEDYLAWQHIQGGGGAAREWFQREPGLVRLANGVAHRSQRLKAIGNGQVPAVAALAWRLLGGPTND